MMRTALCAAITLALAPPVFAAEGKDHDHGDEHREAGAHEHGHGSFAMAIEGPMVAIELEVPAHDIVGFEHMAETDAQRAAVEAAETALSAPLTLFVLPSAAGCEVSDAHIMIGPEGEAHHGDEHEEHHDEHDDEHEKHDDEHNDEESTHSEVHAEYELTCADASAIDRIDFAYFDAFPNAEELDVVILTNAGQKAAEATPASRTIDVE